MTRRKIRQTALKTFEEERQEVVESAVRGFAERPGDAVTQAACAYLLQHLAKGKSELAIQNRLLTAA